MVAGTHDKGGLVGRRRKCGKWGFQSHRNLLKCSATEKAQRGQKHFRKGRNWEYKVHFYRAVRNSALRNSVVHIGLSFAALLGTVFSYQRRGVV